ncbi:hypothetical protein Ais01nite_44180 [Asanoa ishikariensis]|uniref:Uncharacterized conserved protein, DUF305 family n=1 Tax=Asanoa ishikariensis TaxID=137265 RepID=A0A1H3MWF7_9ACTN|nr:DUF305 domain-containing protein [Asanoa ishikariensis]GIF66383.1 hypothetical protein Ais01nite_44180 [Asanoa ishikariensis]SDY80936.1 Uncharacterized conserved protein, DUF305 family [Asanoa ishikariensis]
MPPEKGRGYRLAGVAAALVVTALVIAGVQLAGRGSNSTASAQPAPTAPASIVLNATDDAFLQLMIPIDESALVFLKEAQGIAQSPALRALTAQLADSHQTELKELRALLAAGGTAEQNLHEGHRMPGMIFDDQVAELRSAPEAARDAQAITLLRGHLEQCEVLATGEQTAGGSDETRAFAVRLKRLRTEQLNQLAAI